MADPSVADLPTADPAPPVSDLPTSDPAPPVAALPSSDPPPPGKKPGFGIGGDAAQIMQQVDPQWQDKTEATRMLSEYFGFESKFAYGALDQISTVLWGKKLTPAEMVQRMKDAGRYATTYRSRNEAAFNMVQRGHITAADIQKLQDMTKDLPQDQGGIMDKITRQGLDFLLSMGYAGKWGLGVGGAAALTTELAGQAASGGLAASVVGIPEAGAMEAFTQFDAAASFGTMFSVGFAGAMSVDMGRQATGQAFADLMSMKDDKGRSLDPNVAAQSANVVGLVTEAAMAATAAFGPTAQGIAKRSVQKGVMSLLVDGSFKKTVLGLLGRGGLAAGTMAGANLAQESTSLLMERVAKLINNSVNGTTFTQAQADEVIRRLEESTLAGAVQGLMFHLPEAGLEVAGLGARGKPAIKLTPEEATALLKTGVTPESVKERQMAAIEGRPANGSEKPSALPPSVDPNTQRFPNRPQMQPVPGGHTLTPDGKIVPNTQTWNNKYGMEAYDEFKRDLADTVQRSNDRETYSEEQRTLYAQKVRQMRRWHPEFTAAVDRWNKSGRPAEDPGPEGISVRDAVENLKAPGDQTGISIGESGSAGYQEARARARETADADIPGYDTGNPYLTADVPMVPEVAAKMSVEDAMKGSRTDRLDLAVKPAADQVLFSLAQKDTNPESMKGLETVLDSILYDKEKKLMPDFTAAEEKYLRGLAKKSAADLSEYDRQAVRRIISWADAVAGRRNTIHWMNRDVPLNEVVKRNTEAMIEPRFWKGQRQRLLKPLKWFFDLQNQMPLDFSSMFKDMERSEGFMETAGQSHELSNTHKAVRAAVRGEMDSFLKDLRNEGWAAENVTVRVGSEDLNFSRAEVLMAALLRENPRAWSAVLREGVVRMYGSFEKLKDSDWMKLIDEASKDESTAKAIELMRKGIDAAHPMVNDVRMRMAGWYSSDRGEMIPFEQFNPSVHDSVHDAVVDGLSKEHSVARIGDTRASKIGPLQTFRPAEGRVVLRNGLTAFNDFADKTAHLVSREEWADKMQRWLAAMKDEIVSRFGAAKFENLVRHVNGTLGGKTYEGQLESLFEWARRAGAITAVAGRISPVLKNFALAIRTLSFAGEHPGDWYRFLENIIDNVAHFREADARATSYSPEFFGIGVKSKGSILETQVFADAKQATRPFSRFGQKLTNVAIAPLKWASRNVVKWDINYMAKTLLSDIKAGRLREDFLTANWRHILDENGVAKSKEQLISDLKASVNSENPELFRQMAGRWGEWVAMHSHATMEPETRSAMYNAGWAGRIISTLGSEVNAKTNLIKYRFLDALYEYRKTGNAKKFGRFVWTAAVTGVAESLLIAEIDHMRRKALGLKQPGQDTVKQDDPMITRYFKTRWEDIVSEQAALMSYGGKQTFQTIAGAVKYGPYATPPGSSNIVGGLAKSALDFAALSAKMMNWKNLSPQERQTTLDRWMEAVVRSGSAASGYPISGMSDALAEVMGLVSGYKVDPGAVVSGTGPLVQPIKQPGQQTPMGTGK